MSRHPNRIPDAEALEESEQKPKRRPGSLRDNKKQSKLLETLIWKVYEDQEINSAARADGVAKLMKLFREVLADDLEEKIIVAFEEIQRLKQALDRRSAVKH